jgi:cell division protein FtsI (penicillin-binding protein 3)
MEKISTFPIFNRGQFEGGFIANKKDKRIYPYGRLAYRTIGYISENEQAGVVLNSISFLFEGTRANSVCAVVRVTTNGSYCQPARYRPQDGLDVVSTLDIEIQGRLKRHSEKQLAQNETFEGATAVVMEVQPEPSAPL